VCSLHTGLKINETLECYRAYREYFGQIVDKLAIPRTTDNIRQLKRIDNALVAFGQFLRAYYR
jgi:hypothetical protein